MKEFKIAPFGGLSAAAIEAHLGLYKGYAEQTATITKELQAGTKYPTASVLTPRETLARRLAFEGNGEHLHEVFFEQFVAPSAASPGQFDSAVSRRFGSFQAWQDDILELGKTRGPGWVATCVDARGNVENYWIDLHELTIPADATIVYLVDLWEHAYWSDYGAKGRERFMRDLFANSNWQLIEQRYSSARRPTT